LEWLGTVRKERREGDRDAVKLETDSVAAMFEVEGMGSLRRETLGGNERTIFMQTVYLISIPSGPSGTEAQTVS
jgi:hypothetical protein